jgi:hypothetical protein
MRGSALFVLCQSDDLDRSHILRLTGLFSARKGPQHQLLVVELDDAEPLESLPLIEAAMESVARTAPANPDEGDARIPRRDVVAMPGESSARNSIPNFDEPEEDDPRVLELREAEALARDREARAREDAERLQREADERRAREEAERKAREEAEHKAREEAEREAREEAERKAREEAERKAREEAERKAREEAERKAQEEAEALARAFHEEMVAAEAVLERRTPGRRSPDPRVDDPEPEPGIPETIIDEPSIAAEALELDRPAIGTAPKDDDLEAGPTPSAESVDELSRDSADQIGTLSNSLAGVRVAEPLAGVPLPDSIPTELTPTDTRRRHREPEDTQPAPPSQLEKSESRRGWLLATLGAAALGAVAVFAVQEPESVTGRGAPAAAATAPAKAQTQTQTQSQSQSQSQPTAKPLPGKGAAPSVEAKPPPSPAPDVNDAAKPAPAPVHEDDVTPPPVKAPEPAAPVAAATPQPGPPPAPTSVPPPPVDSEALKVDDAIRSGKVRAIDSLLIAKAGTDTVDWAQAKASCRRKRVAGLPGWRLPTRRQLARLRRSRIVESGTYWSREKGPHDDDAYAVNAKSGAENLYLQEEPAARVQCVRKR